MRGKSYKDYLTAEQKTHAALVEWLRWDSKYRDVRWFHYMAEGRRSKYERFLWHVMGAEKSVSDFLFFSRRKNYCGLAIELKADGVKLYKKNGECYFPEQEKFLKDLEKEGWKTSFQVGYDDAKKEIEKYFEE